MADFVSVPKSIVNRIPLKIRLSWTGIGDFFTSVEEAMLLRFLFKVRFPKI